MAAKAKEEMLFTTIAVLFVHSRRWEVEFVVS
jgi:hypothetical protein